MRQLLFQIVYAFEKYFRELMLPDEFLNQEETEIFNIVYYLTQYIQNIISRCIKIINGKFYIFNTKSLKSCTLHLKHIPV